MTMMDLKLRDCLDLTLTDLFKALWASQPEQVKGDTFSPGGHKSAPWIPPLEAIPPETKTASQLCEIANSLERKSWAYLKDGRWYVPTNAELADMRRDESKLALDFQTQFYKGKV